MSSTGSILFQGHTIQWSGRLVEIDQPTGVLPSRFEVTRLTAHRDLRVKGWSRLEWITTEPMLESDKIDKRDFYKYEFLVRESDRRYLMLATHRELVDRLLDAAHQRPLVHSPTVRVDKLTAFLVTKPDEYSLSALWADVVGFGRSLRRIALYGDDVTTTPMCRALLPSLTPYRVQLRLVRGRRDVLSIAAVADVSFSQRDSSALRDVDQCMKFLTLNGFLDWTSTDAPFDHA